MVIVTELGVPALAIAFDITLLIDRLNVSGLSTISSSRIITDTSTIELLTEPTAKVAMKGTV